MSTRYESLDLLRGLAILGILVMNIQSFAMPWPAYANPYAYGSMEGIHGWVYWISHIGFDTKFYSLFALMFGVGIALMAERLGQRQQPMAGLHYRRMLLLALIGLLHGFLIWYGDILFMYAVCGGLAYLFLKRRTPTLVIWGLLFLLIPVLLSTLFYWSLGYAPDEVYAELAKTWSADSPDIQGDMESLRGGWTSQLPQRAQVFLQVITWGFLTVVLWHALGLMLLGMALYRSGFFTLGWTARQYQLTAGLGLILGLTLVLWGVSAIEARDWSFPWTKFVGQQFNELGAPLMALAYASLLMLACRHAHIIRRLPALAAVGQTALSNYLFQSVACTLIFYGHGLGLFGDLERAQQLLVVLLVWAIQLPASLWWVRRFHYGPVEWLWRAGSRLERPPFRRRSSDPGVE